MPRYSLLRHIGAPDDPSGCHYDFLLEDGDQCLTWRMPCPPVPNGLPIEAVPLPAHRLIWLELKYASVSNNRGWAEQVMSGIYKWNSKHENPTHIDLEIIDGELQGRLRILNNICLLKRP